MLDPRVIEAGISASPQGWTEMGFIEEHLTRVYLAMNAVSQPSADADFGAAIRQIQDARDELNGAIEKLVDCRVAALGNTLPGQVK